jgi:hypothetical protein
LIDIRVLIATTLLASTIFAVWDAAAANLVVNPGFETGDFTGWFTSGDDMEISTHGSPSTDPYVHKGHYGGQFGPVGSDGLLQQTISTVPGQNYFVSFWFNAIYGPPNDFSVSFAGQTLLSLVDYNGVGHPPFGEFKQYSYEATATGTGSVLSFAIRQDFGYQGLDDVWVGTKPAGVPEPATWAMSLIGLGAVGGFLRTMGRKVGRCCAL